jgi:hypothetical protein
MSNARLQQWMSLALAGLALAWVLSCAQQGLWGQAAWAGLAWVPHAPVLALEFFWASQLARDTSARRERGSGQVQTQAQPRARQWLGAWWQEIWMGLRVFGWQQPWAHQAHADHLPPDALGRRGVLLVHGFYCNRGFWNTWMPRLRQAGIPFVALTLGPPQASIAQQARGIEPAVRRLTELTGCAPLLVGHSMGGLVIRSWLVNQTEDTALRHEVITIGSPHHGTALARLAHSPAAIEMRQGSDFLLDLMRRETDARRSRLSCYWSVCDNIVFPASTATLAGARNIALPGLPHVGLSQAPEIFEDVLRRVNALDHR